MVKIPIKKEGQAIKLSLKSLLFLYKFQENERETWEDLFNKFKEKSERRLKKK